jgi:hypothetical protein
VRTSSKFSGVSTPPDIRDGVPIVSGSSPGRILNSIRARRPGMRAHTFGRLWWP